MTCNSNIINFIVYPSPLPKKSTIVISSSSSQVNGYWSDLLYMCRAARIRNCWLEKMSVHVQHLVFHYVNNYLDSVKKTKLLIINILQMIGQSATRCLVVAIVLEGFLMTSEGCGRSGPRLSGPALEECQNNCASIHNTRHCQGRTSRKGTRMCIRRVASDYHGCVQGCWWRHGDSFDVHACTYIAAFKCWHTHRAQNGPTNTPKILRTVTEKNS